MIDIVNELKAIQRTVTNGADKLMTVQLTRAYDADIEDVWDAITDPERIARWFMPVSGDFRQGGTYQLQGNAGGQILLCDKPHMFRVTWVFGEPQPDDLSEVEVRLTEISSEQTQLELEHVARIRPEFALYGPGAVGVGWDGGLMGLGLYLAGGEMSESEREAWPMSAEARVFNTDSSAAWGVAYAASGADPETVAKAVAATTEFYVPPMP